MAQQASAAPSTKVQAGTACLAACTLIVAILKRNGIEIDADEALAISTLITFLVQYFVPPTASPRDQVVNDPPLDKGKFADEAVQE